MEPIEHEDEIKKTIDKHGGLINKQMASNINNEREIKTYQKMNVVSLLKASALDGDIVSIEDKIYRIFNKITINNGNIQRIRRIVVLGDEGKTITTVLWDKNCNFIDSMLIQRGDRVSISSLKVKKSNDEIELTNTAGTYIVKTSPSYNFRSNFSEFIGNEKNIDILGRILSISPIRYFKDLDGKQSGVSECSITDGTTEAHVTMWRSSSTYSSDMHPGMYVKIEFASVKILDEKIEITASDTSRILIGQGLGALVGKTAKS